MEKEIKAIVDITEKSVIRRSATATGLLKISQSARTAIINDEVKKGNVIEASTIAAVQAVKETPRIIPHCHPIPLEGCDVNWNLDGDGLRCNVSVLAHYKTGIEMEAITGVCAGLLCALDMIKSFEKDSTGQYPNTEICDVRILEKVKSE
ncbi:MAG: cyclic pyranopterin monophosphate synthase MoaC [Euryarchaeota archaeon]|jgi:cyclic pyranopterin phosphate synthase|nr:cyclic pyranopterin monophosphate synthase MoaC [Euryarchaeota archaeon]|tara:strand:+ start:825 stop:1274 length:450 start_codon:yes stop_codon:yes gene_type:complete